MQREGGKWLPSYLVYCILDGRVLLITLDCKVLPIMLDSKILLIAFLMVGCY